MVEGEGHGAAPFDVIDTVVLIIDENITSRNLKILTAEYVTKSKKEIEDTFVSFFVVTPPSVTGDKY